MSELRNRSAMLADFAGLWLNKGGSSCRVQDIMSEDVMPRLIIVCRRNGEWYCDYAGSLHYKMNRVPVTGRLADHLPPHIWSRTRAMLERCLVTGQPQMIESTGHIGRSIDLLIRNLRVVCTPPEGADAAIAIVGEWKDSLEPQQEDVLADIVERCAGAALSAQFLSDRPGVARVSAQLALLRELVEGAYGSLSPADRTYLQIFLLGLHAEYDTDGNRLFEIH